MRADTVVPCVCRPAWIYLEVDWGSLSTIWTILSCTLSVPSTSREVSYSAIGCKLLDDVAHSGHRNIKISGDGHLALRLSMLFHNFGSQIVRHPYALLSFLHAQYGTDRHATQRLSQLFSILTGCKCGFYVYCQHLLLATGEFKYKLKEHHMQV